jgi:hypothetical protein
VNTKEPRLRQVSKMQFNEAKDGQIYCLAVNIPRNDMNGLQAASKLEDGLSQPVACSLRCQITAKQTPSSLPNQLQAPSSKCSQILNERSVKQIEGVGLSLIFRMDLGFRRFF